MTDSQELYTPPEIDEESLHKFQRDVYEWFMETLDTREKTGLINPAQRRSIMKFMLQRRDLEAEKARIEARLDPLTGLPNRRAFDEELDKMISSKDGGALLIMDIDKFKDFNDNYGHAAGDSALIQVGLLLESGIRLEAKRPFGKDLVTHLGRWGGEELAVVLRGVKTAEELYKIAERLRKLISNQPLTIEKGLQVPLTVSIGGSLYQGEPTSEFFETVDQRLYDAKQEGRNMTVINLKQQYEKAA